MRLVLLGRVVNVEVFVQVKLERISRQPVGQCAGELDFDVVHYKRCVEELQCLRSTLQGLLQRVNIVHQGIPATSIEYIEREDASK